jgi:hypothetical protein
VSFGQSFVLVSQILYLLLKGVQFISKRDIFHGLLTNMVVLLLQLVGSIFYCPEFVRLDFGSISQGLFDRKKRSENKIPIGKVRYHQYRTLAVENLYNS